MPFDNLDNVPEPPWSDALGYIRPLDIVQGWARAYREGPPEARFPSDPNAEFFPRDMDAVAAKIDSDAKVIAALRKALEPFAKIGTVWLFDGTADDYAVAGNAGGVVTAAAFKTASRTIEQTAGEKT
jgi:hypothetical protein